MELARKLEDIPQKGLLQRWGEGMFRWSTYGLVATVWTSALLFGLYILAFYAWALLDGDMERWNGVLPSLYERDGTAGNVGIGAHFAAGGIILVLGCIQLLASVRDRFPAFHRWTGRLYVTACIVAAVGGFVFIALRGTIGGTVMDVGFGLYGILMLIAAIETYRHAVARRTEVHRAWALRLFALAIGSWLYRMDYGFWLMLGGGGHSQQFDGPFDMVMAFFFYIPNLLVVELYLRSRAYSAPAALKIISAFALLLATGFLLLGTYYFTLYYWGPAILSWIAG